MLGVFAFAYQGISDTTRNKAVDLGPIQVTTESESKIPLSPIVGGSRSPADIVLPAAGNR